MSIYYEQAEHTPYDMPLYLLFLSVIPLSLLHFRFARNNRYAKFSIWRTLALCLCPFLRHGLDDEYLFCHQLALNAKVITLLRHHRRNSYTAIRR